MGTPYGYGVPIVPAYTTRMSYVKLLYHIFLKIKTNRPSVLTQNIRPDRSGQIMYTKIGRRSTLLAIDLERFLVYQQIVKLTVNSLVSMTTF